MHGTYTKMLSFFFSVACWFSSKFWSPWTQIPCHVSLVVPTLISVPYTQQLLSYFQELVYVMDADHCFFVFYQKLFYPNFSCQCHTTHYPAWFSPRPDNAYEHSYSGIYHFFFWSSLKIIDYISFLDSDYPMLWYFPFYYKLVFLVDYAPPKKNKRALFFSIYRI